MFKNKQEQQTLIVWFIFANSTSLDKFPQLFYAVSKNRKTNPPSFLQDHVSKGRREGLIQRTNRCEGVTKPTTQPPPPLQFPTSWSLEPAGPLLNKRELRAS